MANESTKSCMLWIIPRELRDEIYKFTFAGTIVFVSNPCIHHQNAGLLLACKDARREAIELYYKYTIFSVIYGENHLEPWIRRTPLKYIKLVRNFRVSLATFARLHSRDRFEDGYSKGCFACVKDALERYGLKLSGDGLKLKAWSAYEGRTSLVWVRDDGELMVENVGDEV